MYLLRVNFNIKTGNTHDRVCVASAGAIFHFATITTIKRAATLWYFRFFILFIISNLLGYRGINDDRWARYLGLMRSVAGLWNDRF